MERECKAIQEALVEVKGDLDGLDGPLNRHVESCPSCRAVADAERGLEQVLSTAVPPENPVVIGRVMESLGPVRLRRRVASAIPVVASLMLAFVGVAMIGGVPGSSLLQQLPTISSQSWLAIADATADWGVAMTAAAGAAKVTLSPALQLVSLLVGLGGLFAVITAARRWQPIAPWQRDD